MKAIALAIRRLVPLLMAAPLAGLSAPLDLVPDALIGKNSFTEAFTSVSASQLAVPHGIAEDPITGELWVSDEGHRVLRFPSAAAYAAGQAADLVIGQATFTASLPNFNQEIENANGLKNPRGIAVNQLGHLYVADTGNSRVLIFRPPFSNGMAASVVIGQQIFSDPSPRSGPTGLSQPFGVALDARGHLYVSDTGNGRVGFYSAPHTTGQAIEFEFGKAPAATPPARYELSQPGGIAIDPTTGALWVADLPKNHVMRFDIVTTPPANNQADAVLCQGAFENTGSGPGLAQCSGPSDVTVDASGVVYVNDLFNGRIMRFPPNAATGAAALDAIPTTAFICGTPGTTPCQPTALMSDRGGNLHVADQHARVIRYDQPNNHPVPQVASLGPATQFAGAGAFVLTVNGLGLRPDSFVNWDGQARPTQYVSSQRLLAQLTAGDVANVANHAVTVTTPGPGGGTSAPLAFAVYSRAIFDGLADRLLMGTAFTYPAGVPFREDLITGEEQYGDVSAYSLRIPANGFFTGRMAVSGNGRLFLVDGDNSRVMSWANAAAVRNGQPADLIIGQPDEFGRRCNTGGRSARTLCNPTDVAVDAQGAMYVTDGANHRALKFVPPFATGMAASRVFGQSGDFTTGTLPAAGVGAPNTLRFPFNVAVSAGALWVFDFDYIVRRYPGPDHSDVADLHLGSPTSPCPGATTCFTDAETSIAFDAAGRLYIGQAGVIRRFSPPFTNEPASDLTLSGTGASAMSATKGFAFDPTGALLVADTSKDRVLRFVPPFSSAMTATGLLGQPDLLTTGGLPGRERLQSPRTVAADSYGNVYVTQAGRVGILAYDAPFGFPAGGDYDADGIPNGLEASEGRDPFVKDNDVFGNPRLFTMQQYRDFLGREGDTGGIAFYTDHLNAGTLARANVVENFFNSPEFQGVGSPIARLYFATFLRTPDYPGLIFQINIFRSGAALAAIANNFTLSGEFQTRYGTLTNAQYVTLLYQNILGRTPVQAEIDFHVNRLASGTTRGEVLVGFSESPEYKANIANEVYVTMMYVGMLRRAPEPAGLTFWVNYMDAGNPGLALILGFLNSPEYRNRFLP